MLKLRTIGFRDYSVLEGEQRICRIRFAVAALRQGGIEQVTGYRHESAPVYVDEAYSREGK